MSRLTDLISQVKSSDPELGKELEREFRTLSSRLPFGLNFERHTPESVELPGRPIRKGDKVHILPPRGSTKKGDQRLWRVIGFQKSAGKRTARIEFATKDDAEVENIPAEDLVVVAEFRDYIYPGLVSTGKVERGGNKPFHTVINAENFHALEALTFTHRGKIDAIYIDPPYNTGAKDWKYNNDYVEGEDIYRHSKWLAMMERRLFIARELLNPVDSVLIVTIDEKEVYRLALLLEQTFPEAKIQMISSVISPKGSARAGEFSRCDEYLFFVMQGAAGPSSWISNMLYDVTEKIAAEVRWGRLLRRGDTGRRVARPNLFYPIYFDAATGRFHSIGSALHLSESRLEIPVPPGTVAMWPLSENGSELTWSISPEKFAAAKTKGWIRFGKWNPDTATRTPYHVLSGTAKAIADGTVIEVGLDDDDAAILKFRENVQRNFRPMTTWSTRSHSASDFGTKILSSLLPNCRFPFPKSLYAVEDTLRFFVGNRPEAVILDFFSGSGTTAHAVMRLNKQDGGRRQCISVTNNEVAADEQKKLCEQGLRPGDADWEKWGICDYITKPRIEAAITGKTPDGNDIRGEYKFTDEFPMSEGFEENAEFFTLTYEAPIAVSHNHAFARIAPLLWIKAGCAGERIDDLPKQGWAVAETYGLLIDLDKASKFCKAMEKKDAVRMAFIVTDDDRRFQSVARRLPHGVEPIRLYEAYLTNFRFSLGQ